MRIARPPALRRLGEDLMLQHEAPNPAACRTILRFGGNSPAVLDETRSSAFRRLCADSLGLLACHVGKIKSACDHVLLTELRVIKKPQQLIDHIQLAALY